jgi:hypothetical protein
VDFVATLRIVFIVLAASFGTWLTAAGALGVWELILASSTANAVADGPPEFSFSTYGYIPAVGAVALVGAVAALKRRWEALALVCWLLTGGVLVDVIDAILSLGWTRVPAAIGTAWPAVALLGFALVMAARQRGELPVDAVPSASRQEKIRLRNTLVSLVVVSYLWRAVFIVLNPAAAGAISILRGTSGVYLLTNGVVALAASTVLLVCAIVSFKGHDRVMDAALAFTAGLAFEGFLDALDFALIGGARLEIMYALQDAVSFVACCCALALSVRPAHETSRLPA